MQRPLPKSLINLWNDLKQYLLLRLEVFKLTAIEKAAKLIADLISNFIVVFFVLLAFLAVSVTLAFYFSTLFGSYAAGFSCIAAFFVLFALLLQWKKAIFRAFIAAITIKKYFEKHHEAELEQKEQERMCVEKDSVRHLKPWLK
ncbi:hypothetical protein [Pedobacter sp. V48]|uniref:hypothetical protein n=1 Tax=Pedobacter sp. V48 TaxID=509635 RepID=UPI0003E4C543|nr:hypothetical protein [Pedobacter sp. V48]ETZ24361.1 hypothetical protein N824_12650 [Pedobacter sp. V48]